MSGGSGPHKNTPATDGLLRTNGGNKKLIGDDKQSAGGRETWAQRTATTHAAYMKAAGLGTHTGYVTCPVILALCELLLCMAEEETALHSELCSSADTATALAHAVDGFNLHLVTHQHQHQCSHQCGDTQRCVKCNTANLETTTLQKWAHGGYADCRGKITEEKAKVANPYYSTATPHHPDGNASQRGGNHRWLMLSPPPPPSPPSPPLNDQLYEEPRSSTAVFTARGSGDRCGACYACLSNSTTRIFQCFRCSAMCHEQCFEAVTDAPARCLACRDMDTTNSISRAVLTEGNDGVTWPDKQKAPETPTNPIELALRMITVLWPTADSVTQYWKPRTCATGFSPTLSSRSICPGG